ncbi:unnamed protein product [Zymoseptoria tritici ST99CH_3D1]|nr:unnamed protein product [Zymoseptoria tritici ST99CH_3D1]
MTTKKTDQELGTLPGGQIKFKPRGSRLLDLPPELRNSIFRIVVESANTYISVTSQGYYRPPLLQTCKAIRQDALKLFYCTNVFSVQVVDFDYTPIHKFIAVPRAEKCRKLIDFRIHLVGEPNWANLVEWVKRYHRGTGPFYHIPRREGNLVRPFLRGFFSMAQVMEGQDWPLVEKTMCAMRPALVALDPGWAT